MKKNLLFILLLFSVLAQAQINEERLELRKEGINKQQELKQQGKLFSNQDSLNKASKKKRLPNLDETHYKFISIEYDTIHLDTTITIHKEYRHNYLRKDLFELLAFPNMGQTFNHLGYSFQEPSDILPQIGVSAKQYNYLKAAAIYYYHVPTPFSDIMHKTGMERGQVLDALVTTNVKPELNFFVGYKGLHSSGKYLRSLSSHGNLKLGFSYDKKRYQLRGHYTVQDLHNEENAGLTADAISKFESEDVNFLDRRRMLVNRDNDSTIFRGNRVFIDQNYALRKQDSVIKNDLTVFHRLQYEKTSYLFEGRATSSDIYGLAYQSNIRDSVYLKNFSNKVGIRFKNKYLGAISASANYFNYSYGYNTILHLVGQTIPDKLIGDALTVEGTWKNKLGGFSLDAKATITLGDLVNGNQFYAKAGYQLKDWQLNASILNQEKTASFNKILYQSDYKSYNWYNDFKTEKTRNLAVELSSKKWGKASASWTNLDDYIYFENDAVSGQAKPTQYTSNINYLKLKYENDLHFGKFGLANTILFQEVTNGDAVFKVPTFITRNSLYYTNYVFDNAMELQTGVTFKYFSKYQANDFNPLLNEFVVQNNYEIGNYPQFDFFVNARVMRARIFLKAENLSSSFTGRKYYSARNYPYHDFMVRFGIVWNFLR
jgi:hypothetical protein